VIHGFAAAAGGFNRDGQVFFYFGLAGKIGKPIGAERGLELPFFFPQ